MVNYTANDNETLIYDRILATHDNPWTTDPGTDQDIDSMGFTTTKFNVPGTICIILVFAVISIGSVIGNLLVILAYKEDPALRKPANVLLVGLAVTDLLTGLIGIPLNTVNRTVESNFTCFATTRYLLYYPAMIFGISSITHLTFIAIERYLAVSQPLRYQTIVTKTRCFKAVVIGGLVCCLLCAAPFAFLPMNPGETKWFCKEEQVTLSTMKFLDTLCAVIITYFVIMVLCYYHIIRVAMKHVRLRRTLSAVKRTGAMATEDFHARLRATITVGMIFAAFIISWAPILFKFLYQSHGRYTANTFSIVQILCEIPLYANSMVNPIIYGYRNKRFRTGYKRVLFRWYSCVPGLKTKGLTRKNTRESFV